MSNIHALIIDDNRMNIDVLSMLLDKEAVNHTAADSVRRVPQALDSMSQVDIVFLDLEFPNGNGFDLLEVLKTDPRLTNVPVVAYSVHTSEIDEARRAGFHSFIGKPLNAHHFPEQLRLILSGQRVWDI